MSVRTSWCAVCRGDGASGDDLLKCKSCPKRFHLECAGLTAWPADSGKFCCAECSIGNSSGNLNLKARIRAVRASHTQLKARQVAFYQRESAQLAPFISRRKLAELQAGKAPTAKPLVIGPHEPYINATLRPYQVDGVNWILKQYALGTGGILGDEMGLGKTVQTLTFISALKAAGLPGPHLVVTPLAVLQNWSNEVKRFCPGLSVVKVHGGVAERDRLLSDPAVLGATFDIYLTTYDTLRAEEAFFTEAFLFHTITIDEGHRLKNEASSLCATLSRITVPFRLLLTGTPLQNNLHELWALLSYILPGVLTQATSSSFDEAADVEAGAMDRTVVGQARGLLESLMIRRVKSEVEGSLLPKLEYVLRPPLTPLQRDWYRILLQEGGADGAGDAAWVDTTGAEGKGGDCSSGGDDGGSGGDSGVGVGGSGGGGGGGGSSGGLLTSQQLMAKMLQLQKVVNHPKTIALTIDRDRAAAAAKHAAAAGSEFIKLPPLDSSHLPPEAREREAALRALRGERLVDSSGKLALLDRLLLRLRKAGSRALIFSQYTLTLDVLEEYATGRWGPLGTAYFRLDGTTNRIAREMDMRSFNAPGSAAFLYLISTRAGGQGINLATADTVVLYDTVRRACVRAGSFCLALRATFLSRDIPLAPLCLTFFFLSLPPRAAPPPPALPRRAVLQPPGGFAGPGPRPPHRADEAGPHLPSDRRVEL